jgi:hypothetical protein
MHGLIRMFILLFCISCFGSLPAVTDTGTGLTLCAVLLILVLLYRAVPFPKYFDDQGRMICPRCGKRNYRFVGKCKAFWAPLIPGAGSESKIYHAQCNEPDCGHEWKVRTE